MSNSRCKPQAIMSRTSQIKKQISQRVSSRLREKRLMEIQQVIQSSSPEHNPKPELVIRTKMKSQPAVAGLSMTVANMPSH